MRALRNHRLQGQLHPAIAVPASYWALRANHDKSCKYRNNIGKSSFWSVFGYRSFNFLCFEQPRRCPTWRSTRTKTSSSLAGIHKGRSLQCRRMEANWKQIETNKGFIAFCIFLHILVSFGSIFAFAKLTFERMQRHAETRRSCRSQIFFKDREEKELPAGKPQPSIIPDHPSTESKTSKQRTVGDWWSWERSDICHRFWFLFLSCQDVRMSVVKRTNNEHVKNLSCQFLVAHLRLCPRDQEQRTWHFMASVLIP